jgi:CheY-like chemotaxis protein
MAHILIAEDEPTNAQMMAFICRRAGHSVRVAGNGLRALVLLGEESFDLALVDVLMPELDGAGLTRMIRMNERHRGMPVIGVTALPGRDDHEELTRAGMDRVIGKPFHASELTRAIEEALAAH